MKFEEIEQENKGVKWIKARDLIVNDTQFDIIDAEIKEEESFYRPGTMEEVVVYDILVDEGDGVPTFYRMSLKSTPARLRVAKQVQHLNEQDDQLEGVYLVMDQFEKTPARKDSRGRHVAATYQEYMRFSGKSNTDYQAAKQAITPQVTQEEFPF